MDTLESIRETFFQECDEQLAELERGLVAMEDGCVDAESVNAMFRAVHSMKGGAGAFELTQLVRFAHGFETALDELRSGRLSANPAMARTMLRAADVLSDLVAASRDGAAVEETRIGQMLGELAALGATNSGAMEAGVDDFAPLALSIEDIDEFFDRPRQRRIVVRFRPKASLAAKGGRRPASPARARDARGSEHDMRGLSGSAARQPRSAPILSELDDDADDRRGRRGGARGVRLRD